MHLFRLCPAHTCLAGGKWPRDEVGRRTIQPVHRRGVPTVTVPTRALISLLAAWLPAHAQVNQPAIDDVAAGKLTEAKASWWGFDPEDATDCLQAAINSGVPKLTVDNLGKPWIVRPMQLASNQEIVFETGVEVLAKKGEFKGGNDALFKATLKENITLNGHGATLRMQRADYDGPEYAKAEWRHVLSFHSCTNVKVYGLTLTESGGDGIYLGTGKAGVTNKGFHIKDVVCDNNYRQGISVITAEDLLIENTILRDTGGTAPMAGIDFEPNHPEERLVNCVMRDCLTQGNKGYGYVMYVSPMEASSEPISLRFENCRSLNDNGGAWGLITGNGPDAAVTGSVEAINCILESSAGPGILVGNKPVTGAKLRFENCQVLDCYSGHPEAAPIVFSANAGASEPIGGVEFANLLIRDPVDRKPITLADVAGGVGLKDLTGTFILERNGEQQTVELTEKLLGEWVPAATLRIYPRFAMKNVAFVPVTPRDPEQENTVAFARFRTGARYVLYAEQGDQVKLKLAYGQVGKYSGATMPAVAIRPSGAKVAEVSVPFLGEAELDFEARRGRGVPGGNEPRVELRPGARE